MSSKPFFTHILILSISETHSHITPSACQISCPVLTPYIGPNNQPQSKALWNVT